MPSHSNSLLSSLLVREQEGRPIRVGIVGTGDYGESLVAQLRHIPGMRAVAVCDLVPQRAIAAYGHAGYQAGDVRRARTGKDVNDAVMRDEPVITDDARLILESPVDVIVDCTGEVNFGCELALGAIREGKHVVMVNVEADVTAGAQLAEEARRCGVVYTLADGDQPSLVVGLVDWAESLGFEIVAAGKWTTLYPDDEAIAKLAMLANPKKSDVTYLDGSKTQIEMAAAANAAGLRVDRPGMHRASIALCDMPSRLCPQSAGGLLGQAGIVDVVDCRDLPVGDYHGGGVFTVVTSRAERALRAMAAKGVPVSKDGRYALLFRPYHLVGAETPRSIALAVLEKLPTAAPAPQSRVEVVAVAKRPLAAGTRLSGLGGADVRGLALNIEDAMPYLPLGLTDNVVLTRDVAAGDRLVWGDVVPPNDAIVWSLRAAGTNVA